MKLHERSELWRDESGNGISISERDGQASFASMWDVWHAAKAASWGEADKAARGLYAGLHAGVLKLYSKRWEWTQRTEGDIRNLQVMWCGYYDVNPVTWRVHLMRSRPDEGLSQGDHANHELTGSASTWEEALDKGRAALNALVALPFP